MSDKKLSIYQKLIKDLSTIEGLISNSPKKYKETAVFHKEIPAVYTLDLNDKNAISELAAITQAAIIEQPSGELKKLLSGFLKNLNDALNLNIREKKKAISALDPVEPNYNVNFRANRSKYERFREVLKARNSNPTQAFRQLIDNVIEGADPQQDIFSKPRSKKK